MHDEPQTEIPASFIALYLAPGRSRPSASRADIGARHEFCEDLAQLLTDHAKAMFFDLGITEDDVLERCRRGLCAEASQVSPAEAGWVICRLAELLGWPLPLQRPVADPGDPTEPLPRRGRGR